MSAPPHITDQPPLVLYPPRDLDARDGSLSEFARALATINARLLAEQQAQQATKQAA